MAYVAAEGNLVIPVTRTKNGTKKTGRCFTPIEMMTRCGEGAMP